MGTEREFDALASDAIAASEKEFFDDAMGVAPADLQDEGDKSLEEMGGGLEGQHESDDDDAGEKEPVAAKDEAETPKPKADDNRDKDGRFQRNETPAERGLRNEMLAERKRAQELAAEIAAIKAQLAARPAVQPQPAPIPAPQQQQPQPQNEPPDRWTDPEGYDKWRDAQLEQRLESKRIARSFEEATTVHGDAFKEAYAAANALDPAAALQLAESIKNSANPGARLVAWHKQHVAMREIGTDPVAFKAKVEAELREKLLNDPEFRKQALGNPKGEAPAQDAAPPKSITRLPPSLNSARGGMASRASAGNASDAELFSEIMGDR